MRATARSTKIVLLCGLVLHTSACEPQHGIGNAVHRDSGGIHITANSDPSDSVRPWIVETEPRTEIGVVEGDPMYQLFQVSDAARLHSSLRTWDRLIVMGVGLDAIATYVMDSDGTPHVEIWKATLIQAGN